jgi:hypothetical protein
MKGNVTMNTCPTCGHTTRPTMKKTADPLDILTTTIEPAPGSETMYADFLARIESGTRKLATGRKRKALKREDPDDYAWRITHGAEDRFLAHAEVAGWVLRRWATPGGTGQVLIFPTLPGGLTPGETVEWDAQTIRDNAARIVRIDILDLVTA